jgi:V/A-type H+-transporting ATPase subunit E
MGLDQVVEEIREEGQQEADAIVAEAEEEAQAIREEAKANAEEEKERILEEAEKEAEAVRRRVVANAELESKKKRLNAESDVLASIRSRVESRLSNLDEEERAEAIESLVAGSGAAEFDEGAKAWGRPADQQILEDRGFTFEDEIDCVGGAVIESPDGSIREDLTFDTILDEIWREEIHEVASTVLEN